MDGWGDDRGGGEGGVDGVGAGKCGTGKLIFSDSGGKKYPKSY